VGVPRAPSGASGRSGWPGGWCVRSALPRPVCASPPTAGVTAIHGAVAWTAPSRDRGGVPTLSVTATSERSWPSHNAVTTRPRAPHARRRRRHRTPRRSLRLGARPRAVVRVAASLQLTIRRLAAPGALGASSRNRLVGGPGSRVMRPRVRRGPGVASTLKRLHGRPERRVRDGALCVCRHERGTIVVFSDYGGFR